MALASSQRRGSGITFDDTARLLASALLPGVPPPGGVPAPQGVPPAGAACGYRTSVSGGSYHRCACRRALAALVGGAGDHRQASSSALFPVGERPGRG